MDDPYGLPADFRPFTAVTATTRTDHLSSSSSSFPEPSFSLHRNLMSTPPHPPPPSRPTPNSTTYQSAAASFPLVSGGGLVELSATSDPHHHHHHMNVHHHLISGATGNSGTSSALYGNNLNHHHDHHHHHDQTLDSIGGVWNNIDSNCTEANNSRWPRQETLTLLEIRSRLNPKFKDTNQKAPLWDEVSRIMAEEHGYQRSGKKCKEKFENLYKYYKKTKEGKAGRQDGKHYRFFRQLEAIYGDQSSNQSTMLLETNNLGRSNPLLYDHHTSSSTPNLNRTANNHESLSFSINSTEFETSSSENNEDDLSAIAFQMNTHPSLVMDDRKMKGIISNRPSRKSSSSWKAKVEDFVDSQMRKIMATQETWMEKMLKSIIEKEEERLAKEDDWRKQEAAKFNQEVCEFWAKEKAWVEARDAALMGALHNFRAGKGIELPSFPERVIGKDHPRSDTSSYANYHRWSEEEISSLIELRSNMDETFQGVVNEYVKDVIWEEIASKMACFGFERTALECKEKWENVSVYVRMTSDCKKKRKEDYYNKSSTTTANYFDNHDHQSNRKHEHHDNHMGLQLMDEGLSPSSSNVGTQMHPNSCFHLLFGEGENLWEKYGSLKLSKDKMNQQVMYNK